MILLKKTYCSGEGTGYKRVGAIPWEGRSLGVILQKHTLTYLIDGVLELVQMNVVTRRKRGQHTRYTQTGKENKVT